MGFPQIVTQIAFTTNPTEATTWTDVSAYVRRAAIRRGRQHEIGRVETGTCHLTLDNRDRRFDPEYTDGPYYGNLRPMRRVRVQGIWAGTTYDLFTGYIEGWPQTWPDGTDALVELQAVDGFKVLAMKKLNTSYTQQTVDERIAAVLDDAGWTVGSAWVLGSATNAQLGTTTVLGPVGDRSLDVSISSVQAVTLNDRPALEHMQECVEAEHGLLFMGSNGAVIFHNRRWRVGQTASYATFGDVAGELPYTDLKTSHDDSEIWNEIRITPTDGTTQTAEDATSQQRYFIRTLSKDNLPLAGTDSEALNMAQWLLNLYKEPTLRVEQMEIVGAADDDLWPQVLGRDLDERVLIRRRPAAGGNIIEQQCHIEGIQHNISNIEMITRWQLSPAETAVYWKLGDPEASSLGVSTTLGY